MSRPRRITVTLTDAQYQAILACIALHESEDDDFPDDPARAGQARARENAWARIHKAWHDAAPRKRRAS